MSVDTWADEFCWVSSAKLAQHPKATDAVLLRHSELKWRGLRAENISRHEFHTAAYWYDPDEALCHRYLDPNMPNPCEICPVAQFRNGVSCHRPAPGEEQSPWADFISPRGHTRNPEPMIALMRQVHEHITGKPRNWKD